MMPHRRLPLAAIACLLLAAPAFGQVGAQAGGQSPPPAQGGRTPGGSAEAISALRDLESSTRDSDSAAARNDVQQAINCLVGPADKRYVAASRPCQAGGRGAIADLADESVRQLLRYAVGQAENALKESDLPSLQQDALAAMDYLHSADVNGPRQRPARTAPPP